MVDLEDRQTEILVEMLSFYKFLDEYWCRQHPGYHAIRKPSVACEACERMFQVKLDLGRLRDEYTLIESEGASDD